jgi:hypothetical protein
MNLSLDAIADGAPLDDLTRVAATALLNRLAVALTRLSIRLLELVEPDDRDGHHDCLLGSKEAAKRLSVAPSWLYRNASQLPFTIHVGAHLRFSERGLDRFIRSRTGIVR